jgi:hypothetical protein
LNIGASAKRSFRKRPLASSACASSTTAFFVTTWRAVWPSRIATVLR